MWREAANTFTPTLSYWHNNNLFEVSDPSTQVAFVFQFNRTVLLIIRIKLIQKIMVNSTNETSKQKYCGAQKPDPLGLVCVWYIFY